MPPDNWFYTSKCKSLFYPLKLLNVKVDYMKIVQKNLNNGDADGITNVDVQCNGRDAFEEKNPLVTQVVDMFHGFFQVFLVCFERLLSNLKIKKLVIPAADDAIPMWTNKFGFKKVPPKMLELPMWCSGKRFGFSKRDPSSNPTTTTLEGANGGNERRLVATQVRSLSQTGFTTSLSSCLRADGLVGFPRIGVGLIGEFRLPSAVYVRRAFGVAFRHWVS
ncbi:hypothetical protein QVD17_11648 [Tagetes erecta]|uniref:Increased DNA methylation 1 C-terminal domain-containing protein n=1 Tax=Tagetes erecta TaxID=13708 RepID=A0AAD8P280_TARER|nr:hypothetical protein QVD17_11648 [Tagetes erecta]